jgi:putative methyltransferase (TIGR04325 family)
MRFINYIKLLVPPLIVLALKKVFVKKKISNFVVNNSGWFNNYSNWIEAKQDCSGYNEENILNKVKESLLKVKNNEAVYERDSVLFKNKQYSERLLIGLLYIAAKNNYMLNVLDFGGSLGSTYFQNREILAHLKSLKWNIVEQDNFVLEGKKSFENDELKFYSNLKDCIYENSIDVIILSSVLQYLDNPYLFIKELQKFNIKNIIIDRTSFIKGQNERICKQIVPERIYKASYPIHFFIESNFIRIFNEKYNIKDSFKSYCDGDYIFEDGENAYWKGFRLELK